MRVLLTGASSFTGAWFARALAEGGHEVVAGFRRAADAYEGLRAERLALVGEVAETRFGVAFGDDAFLELLDAGGFDAVCHHGAEVGDYRSPDFDVAAAFAANTYRAADVARLLAAATSCLVVTGSVFEQDEGVGERPLRAFSAYGLSKGLTAAAFAFHAQREGAAYGKFVIPNPFGPFEEPRFTAYLVRSWRAGEIPTVATPAYVRDNIHVSLLAASYRGFVERVQAAGGIHRLAPSGYVESQGAFAQRFAREVGPRLGLEAGVELVDQVEFPEPRMRVNTDPAEALVHDWREADAWDAVAEYYRRAA